MMSGEDELLAALRQVYDPEVGINVVDLGLIYGVEQRDDCVHVEMTLTTPGCPLHDTIGQAVQRALLRVPGVARSEVELVWDPPWTPLMITDAGKRELGWV
jgi:metal-sulfur cluster biosynthetic enzyme